MPGLSAPTCSSAHSPKDCSSCLGFDTLFAEDRLSDLTVIISGGPEADCHLEDELTLPAHKVLLYVQSPCFQAKIEDWCDEPFNKSSSSKKDGKPVLSLEVPYGGLDIGRKLVQVLYSGSPDLSDMTLKQLLQLAAMADKYVVGRALSAAGEALQQVGWAALSCEEAAAVFEVPDSGDTLAAHQEVVKTARAAAAKRLGALLGDLEEVWGEGIASSSGSSSRSQQLVQLPAEALLYLLSGQHFQAASEDTVFHTVTQWLAAHPGTPADMQRSLASVLRLANCTPAYFTQVVCRPSSWLMQLGFLSSERAALTSALCSMPARQRKVWNDMRLVEVRLAMGEVRPPSRVNRLALEWDIPVQSVTELQPSSFVANIPGTPAPVFWQGREFEVRAEVNHVNKTFDVYLDSSATAVCDIQCSLSARPASDPGRPFLLKVVPKTGLLGARQVLGLQEGHGTVIMSCSIHAPPFPCPYREWWCPLQGTFLTDEYKYTHFKLRVEVTHIQ